MKMIYLVLKEFISCCPILGNPAEYGMVKAVGGDAVGMSTGARSNCCKTYGKWIVSNFYYYRRWHQTLAFFCTIKVLEAANKGNAKRDKIGKKVW